MSDSDDRAKLQHLKDSYGIKDFSFPKEDGTITTCDKVEDIPEESISTLIGMVVNLVRERDRKMMEAGHSIDPVQGFHYEVSEDTGHFVLQTGYSPSKKPHNPMLDKPLKFICATNKETQERALILDHGYYPILAINQHVDATIDALRRLLSVLGVDAVWEINDDWQRGQYEYMD